MNKIDDNIETLISRLLAGEATPAEKEKLESLLKDPDNAAHFERARRAFTMAEKHVARGKQVPLINVDEEWKVFLSRTGQQGQAVSELRPTRFNWIRIAAALVLIAVAAFVINLIVNQSAETRFATLDETKRIELPDGSVVELNRNSTLAFDEEFNTSQRQVRLAGEAFFDVVPDSGKPFIILSGETRVEVVGTSFNVTAYESDPQLMVTVETGVVRFSAAKSAQAVELKAGQFGTYSKKDGVLLSGTNDDVNYRSWSTHHIEFHAAPLQEVIRILNRTYGSNITIAGTIPDTCFVTVTFDQQTLDAVLRVLETTLNLTYRVNGDAIEINSAGC